MCEDIMAAVSGSHFSYQPATLFAYRRSPVMGETYPGIVPAENGVVEGVLYRDVSDAACAKLDAFEGSEYMRTVVQVRLADGHFEWAWAYVFKPELADRLAPGDWDFAHFLHTEKARFEARYLNKHTP